MAERGMLARSAPVLTALLLTTAAASAEDAPRLPSLALDPPPPPSIWKGLYVGSEIFAIAQKGSKALVGGDGFVGYDRVFSNNVVLGLQASAGFAPYSIGHSFTRGYEFATLDARLGYAMGRWTPYLTTGLVLAKPDGGPGVPLSTGDSLDALLGDPGKVEAAPRVGAGVAYAITPHLSVDVGVSVGRGAAAIFP